MIIALFKNNSKLSDEELILKYKSSENNWWLGELYKRYSLAIAGICYNYLKNREEAEDAAMEVFEILTKDLLKYEINSFRAWLPGVVKHHCLKKKDKTLKEIKHTEAFKKENHLFVEMDESLGMTNGEVDHEKAMKQLKAGIESLKDDQRLCIELFFLNNKSYKEIVDETGLDENKVKSHIQNGKRNLKIYLESQVNEK